MDYEKILERVESFEGKHIGYEINISCPNVKKGGMEFGVSPDMTGNLTKSLRKITDKKVLNTKYLISISNPIKINGRKLKIEYNWGEIL